MGLLNRRVLMPHKKEVTVNAETEESACVAVQALEVIASHFSADELKALALQVGDKIIRAAIRARLNKT